MSGNEETRGSADNAGQSSPSMGIGGDVNQDNEDTHHIHTRSTSTTSSFASAASGGGEETEEQSQQQLAPAAAVVDGRSSYGSTLEDKMSSISLDTDTTAPTSKNTSLTSAAPSEYAVSKEEEDDNVAALAAAAADDDVQYAQGPGSPTTTTTRQGDATDRHISLPTPDTPSASTYSRRDSLLKRSLDAHAQAGSSSTTMPSVAASAPEDHRWRDSTATGLDTVALSDSAGSRRNSTNVDQDKASRASFEQLQQRHSSDYTSEPIAGPSTPPAGNGYAINRSSKLISPSTAAALTTARKSSTDSAHNYDMIQHRADTYHHDLEENPKSRRRTLRGSEDLRAHFAKLKEELAGAASPADQEPTESEWPEASQQASTCTNSAAHDEAALIDWDFWGEVVGDYEGTAKTRPKDLSKAIQNGIPPALRGMMWQLMSASKDPELEQEYSQLMRLPSPHEKAIIRDLNRTFPTHEYFHDKAGVGQGNLLNIMKAYSIYDEEVGYCQGMAFVVGPLLLNMPDEEAFCVLVRLMKSYDLRSQYVPDMPGLQLRLYQFDRLLEELLPAVFMHLLRQGIKSSMYASQWFLTLLAYRFPLELVCSVFDLIFAEGVEAIFRFALAVMKRNELKLVELEFEQLLDFLKTGLFEHYKNQIAEGADEKDEPTYSAQTFVREALDVKITPMMLDQYASEWTEMCKQQNAQSLEVEQLRAINKTLSNQVRHLEGSLAQINQEHCELVKQVVATRLEKDELEDELVRVKMALAQESLLREEGRGSIASRSSFASFASSQASKSPEAERRDSQLSIAK